MKTLHSRTFHNIVSDCKCDIFIRTSEELYSQIIFILNLIENKPDHWLSEYYHKIDARTKNF